MKAVKETVRKYYKYVSWSQPVLTSDNMSVAEGSIVTTASSSWNDNTRPYKIMLGAVSSTVDLNYWQINNTNNAQWIQIKFPYKLKITGLSVYTRTNGHYTATVTAYTDSTKSIQIGNSVNTNQALTKYTFLENGNGVVTDTIYLYVDARSGNNTYYGLQNLQITAERLTTGSKGDYDFYEDIGVYKLIKENVFEYYKYVSWSQPVLTSDNMAVAEGNIVTTASSYYIDATRPHKIMLGEISSTTDSNYWQINRTTANSWLQIKFPYQLKITGLSVYTRPKDNYSGKVTAYTDSSKSIKIGDTITTSSALTKYTFLSGGNGIETDTIFLEVTGQNEWFGLQNLQITAEKLTTGTKSDYDFYEDISNYYAVNE